MGDLLNDRDELLKAVQRPEQKKRAPSNGGLWAALIVSNLIFCLLDVISAWTVYVMTNFWLYGILTFMSGFGPLLLHEVLWQRAYASESQKKVAVTGAALALCSILIIGITAGWINVQGANALDAQTAEFATIIVLVLISTTHAILSILYFYLDEGIRTNQRVAQTMASAIAQSKMIDAAGVILGTTARTVEQTKKIAREHGSDKALAYVLRQLADNDGNGIPDILEGKGNSGSPNGNNQRPNVPQFAPNGHQPQMQVYSSKADRIDPADPTSGAES